MIRFSKERLFGLTNSEANHGEDVKELYYYLDATPTHSYLRMLYKYPQAAFPYTDLVAENRRRNKQQPEYELVDTGEFDDDRYFDVEIEYAKADAEDFLLQVTVHNRGPETATIHAHVRAANPDLIGTKSAAHHVFSIAGGSSARTRTRIRRPAKKGRRLPISMLCSNLRRAEADRFYDVLQEAIASADERLVQRQALAGMIWTKQYYFYDVAQWLRGDPG